MSLSNINSLGLLKIWSPQDGKLEWSSNFDWKPDSRIAIMQNVDGTILFAISENLCLYKDGKSVWCKKIGLPNGISSIGRLDGSNSNQISLFGKVGSKMVMKKFDLNTRNIDDKENESIQVQNFFSAGPIPNIASPWHDTVLGIAGNKILVQSSSGSFELNLPSILGRKPSGSYLLSSVISSSKKTKFGIIIRDKTSQYVMTVDTGDKTGSLMAEAKSGELLDSALVNGGNQVATYLVKDDEVTFLSTGDTIKLPEPARSIFAVRAYDAWSGALIISTRGNMYFVRRSSVSWSRAEDLIKIISHQFVELPASVLLKDHFIFDVKASLIENYLNRWSHHISQAKKYISKVEKVNLAPNDTSTVLQKDSFGFKNLFVLLTESGRLAAIETAKGALIWSQFQETSSKHSWLGTFKSVYERVPPLIFLIICDGSQHSSIKIIDALSGKTVDHVEKPVNVVEVLRVENGLILIDDSGLSHKYPSDHMNSAPVLSYKWNKEESSINGLIIVSGAQSVQSWKFRPSGGWKIINVQRRTDSGQIASLGRVLGDRSVLFKYLNPNSVVVTMIKPRKLSIVLLDSSTGRVLFSTTHSNLFMEPNYTPRVPVEFNQNKIVYAFSSLQPRVRNAEMRDSLTQIVVHELYESAQPDFHLSESSSVYNIRPHVVTESFIFQHPVSAIGVTNTKNGITIKEIIVGTPNGQLIGLQSKLLDPRRPHKQLKSLSAEEKEEGLVPYQPYLEENPQLVHSYNLELKGIRKIVSNPTDLESTSFVLSFGNDLFGTRVTPSQTFDRLGESFSKPSLVIVITSLLAGIFVSRRMALAKRS